MTRTPIVAYIAFLTIAYLSGLAFGAYSVADNRQMLFIIDHFVNGNK
jgi:hypothetical protein